MIDLTDKAAEKLKEQLAKRGKGLGIKVGIRTTGCSGLSYVLEFVDNEQGKQHCIEHHDVKGIRIYMDPKHRVYLYGTVMDYVKQGLNEGFDFKNPNERDRCGCGESFRI